MADRGRPLSEFSAAVASMPRRRAVLDVNANLWKQFEELERARRAQVCKSQAMNLAREAIRRATVQSRRAQVREASNEYDRMSASSLAALLKRSNSALKCWSMRTLQSDIAALRESVQRPIAKKI